MLRTTQNIKQRQTISAQMIQSQLLLAVPAMALENEIEVQLESNPALEEVEKDEQTEDEENKDDYEEDDWEQYQSDGKADSDYNNKNEYLLNKNSEREESPSEQLYHSGLENRQILIGEEIIGSLDDDGYLRDDFLDIQKDLLEKKDIVLDGEEFESVLKIIQKFDPVGIASRNLQECLIVQLEDYKHDEKIKKVAIDLLRNNFELFKHKHFEEIAKVYNITNEKVNEVYELIQKLNPKPLDDSNESTIRNVIYPDFIVKVIDGDIKVELADDFIPSLRINKDYLEMYKSKKTDSETKEFVKQKIDSAKFFIEAIQSRRQTLLKVMNAIIERQKDYFFSRGEGLKPMYEKDIAEDIRMDISTVSRVVRGKYVQTDFGIFELKHFFSNAIHSDAGDDISSKVIKDKIKELIEHENKSKPLGDDKLTELVNQNGFNIARRTVAKYREAMRIPKATLRRTLLVFK